MTCFNDVRRELFLTFWIFYDSREELFLTFSQFPIHFFELNIIVKINQNKDTKALNAEFLQRYDNTINIFGFLSCIGPNDDCSTWRTR